MTAGIRRLFVPAVALALLAGAAASCSSTPEGSSGLTAGECRVPERFASVARVWNEQALDAIRRDEPAPTIHARNLFHLSAAMWDAWAAFDDDRSAVLVARSARAEDIVAARVDAVSHAAATVLSARYRNGTGRAETRDALDRTMTELCNGTIAGSNAAAGPGSAAGLGVDIGQAILDATINDGSRERLGYEDTTYAPVNPLLQPELPGTDVTDPNRWQPLELERAVAQNGLPLDSGVQSFIGSQWGEVKPFALGPPAEPGLPFDPGPPPFLGDPASDEAYRESVVAVLQASAGLETGAETIDIGPGSLGGNPLGTDDGAGHPTNEVTGEAYASNLVDRADYLRVIAEYWADGPDSETPPGHWNVIANDVSDTLSPDDRRIAGVGEPVDRLEWDAALYLALNGAMHDSAIAAWGSKRHYDYVRPITMIRFLGGNGQATDPNQASYHPDGLPLIPGLIELITPETTARDARHAHLAEHVDEIAVRVWRGSPDDPRTELSGVGWIRAVAWVPYQRPTFVTPAFASYVSGHSTFSRAGADILTAFTGSPWFPQGLAEHTVDEGGLIHESGPTSALTLQWATYADAADEAGQSRIAGGIHIPADDYAGRVLGADVAAATWDRALEVIAGPG